ncbi:MAG: cytochrome c family protein [Alphaproteobacteria bacterium]|nr:cytochrome c family protein [Alphaproteobacteria bacterium]
MRILGLVLAAGLLAGMAAPAAADAADGAKLFKKKCTTCHRLDETGKKKVGPNLWGVVGRPIASAPGFRYSKGLSKHKGKTWTEENLDAWLTKPRAFAKGTRMAFPGFKKAEQRAAVIAYLRSAVE